MDNLLNLFIANTDKDYLLEGVNFSMIKKISYEIDISPTYYEQYDYKTCKYIQKYSDLESKFIFILDVESIKNPIIITCLNSGKKKSDEMMSYRYMNTEQYDNIVLNYLGMDKFINRLSKNKLLHVLTNFGYILGYIVNNIN
jgi:hypothetical protein